MSESSEHEAGSAAGGAAPPAAATAALALALQSDGPDGALGRETRAWLERQSALAEVELRHLEHEKELAIAAAKRRRYLDRLHMVGVTALAVLGVGAVAIGINEIWQAAHDRGIVLDTASTPEALAAQGLTGTVLADQLVNEIGRIRAIADADSFASSDEVRKQASGEELRVEIPETGLSLQQVVRYLHRTFGHEQHMSAELVSGVDGRLELTVHIEGSADDIHLSGPASELPRLVHEAAEQSYRTFSIVNYIVYLAHTDRPAGIAAARQFAATATGRLERADAYALLSSWEIDRAQAERDAAVAIAIDPLFFPGPLMFARAARQLGHDEAALRELRRVGTLRPGNQLPQHEHSFAEMQRTALEQIAALLGDSSRPGNIDYNDRAGTPDLLAQRALKLGRAHDAAGARELLQQAADAGAPSTATVLQARWFIDVDQGDWPAALVDARAMLAEREQLDATDPALHSRSGARTETLFRPLLALALAHNDAPADAQKLIDATPEDCYPCLRIRAQVAELAGEPALADRWFKEALRQGPSLPFAECEQGERLLARGDSDGARDAFLAAHQKGPHFADPLKGWGDVLVRQGHAGAALEKYDEALRYAPHWQALAAARQSAAALARAP
jgi:tetratricopeptide (TPR) repeat protein